MRTSTIVFAPLTALVAVLPALVASAPAPAAINVDRGRSLAVQAASRALFGAEGKMSCHQIVDNTGADWWLAPCCGLVKCNSNWLLPNIVLEDGETAAAASSVKIRTWDEDGKSHLTPVSYIDVVDAKNDTTGGAWIVGAYDLVLKSIGAPNVGLKAGELTASDDAFNALGGWYGLSFLTGVKTTQDQIPDNVDDFYNNMIAHANSSPEVIRISSACTLDTLTVGQWYTVYNFHSTSGSDAANVTVDLWDVKAVDTVTLSISDLQKCSELLVHLDEYVIYYEDGSTA